MTIARIKPSLVNFFSGSCQELFKLLKTIDKRSTAIRNLMVSKNHKDITKRYTLNDVPLQLQIEAFGDFPIGTRFDKGEFRLIVTAIDIVDGLSVTFDCSQTETTK